MSCPDENLLSAFMQGQLPEAEREAIERHLDTCPSCSSAVVAVVRAADPVASTIQAKITRGEPLADARGWVAGGAAGGGIATPMRPAEYPAPSGSERFAIGRYEIVSMLGRGGMGVVYAARDPALDRPVALKVLRPELAAHASGPERLVREARALARLTHPNVVGVYDVGEDGGRVFVAMELVRGSTLREWQRKAPRSWQQIVDVYRHAGRGLAAAHAAGILHRDFKPENVLVSDDGTAKVGDFGLARLLTADASPESERAIMGTPAYMAPEQRRGEDVGPACDQYAFSVALYEALWGVRPYGDADVGSLRPELTHAARPPAASPVPEWLFAILAKGCDLDPQRRHLSMDVMLAAIDHGLAPPPDGHVRANAILQALLCPAHVGLSAFLLWALLSPSSGSEIATDPVGAARHDVTSAIALAISVGLALLFFSGWIPVGAVWTGINAWGLWKGRRWAIWSTLVYAVISLVTCVGTPYAVYAIVSLWSRARRRPASPLAPL